MKSTLIATVLSAMALGASAYCPNLCSGHGVCGARDTCACYEYIGTTRGDYANSGVYTAGNRDAWTGADCSLRTCPTAYSWSGSTPLGLGSSTATSVAIANADTTVAFDGGADLSGSESFSRGSKIRVVKTADGSSSVHTVHSIAYSAPTNTLTLVEAFAASAATDAGDSVVHYAASEVDGTDALDANGAHAMSECAGQGICDRATGNCECFPGYEGEACTRTVCPNDCSGNGICLAATRLAADASHTYNEAWDNNKHFGCKCDAGFRGPDCSLQECPSDFDPLYGCGGGQCNSGSATGNGNNGACANQNESDCSTDEQRDCSGRGICDYDTGICKCFSGFFGQACQSQTILI